MLVDPDQSLTHDWFISHEDGSYSSYPRHFVVDREGVITYVGINTAPEARRGAIEATLDDYGASGRMLPSPAWPPRPWPASRLLDVPRARLRRRHRARERALASHDHAGRRMLGPHSPEPS